MRGAGHYAWSEKQLVDLFEDIKLLDDNDQHFLGTILLLTEGHRAGINRLEVVDGQQRLISLSLLLEAIKDRFAELEDDEITRKIEDCQFCRGLDRKKDKKIVLGDLDEPDYGKVLALRGTATEDGEKGIKNLRLLNAYKSFSSWISEFSLEDLHRYLYRLTNGTIVVRLDTEKAKDAYKLFETINNRGLRLSPTDIIKNFLLGHASLVGDAELKNVRDSWTGLIVSLDGIETDNYFRHYLMSTLKRKLTFAKLASEFKRYYITVVKEAEILPEYRHAFQIAGYLNGSATEETNGDADTEETQIRAKENPSNRKGKIGICDFGIELRHHARIYSKMLNGEFENAEINKQLKNLKRIESTPVYTFLLRLFSQVADEEKILKELKVIETFILRRHICERRTAELDDIFPKLVEVTEKHGFDNIQEALKEHTPNDFEFEEKFAIYNHRRGENRAKYILERIEYFLIKDQGEYEIKSGDDVHLEHIIPVVIDTKKSMKEYGDWVTYLGENAREKHDRYIDRIGNYTLLAQKLNIKASNNPFLAKREQYKLSNIKLTKDLVARYRAFRYQQVKSRSQEFAKIAQKIWNL